MSDCYWCKQYSSSIDRSFQIIRDAGITWSGPGIEDCAEAVQKAVAELKKEVDTVRDANGFFANKIMDLEDIVYQLPVDKDGKRSISLLKSEIISLEKLKRDLEEQQ